MNSPLSVILEGLVRLIDAVMDLYGHLHDAECRAAESSIIGKSGLEQEIRRRRERMFKAWTCTCLILAAVSALLKSWFG